MFSCSFTHRQRTATDVLPRVARGCAIALTLTLVRSTPVVAQGRTTREQVNSWFTINGDVQVTKRWFADYELNMRWSGPFEEKMQFLPRISARFQPNAALRFNWGYNYTETWPYGKLPPAFKFPEHRMWEQVQLAHPLGRANVSHRYRLEQRWQGRVALEDGEERVQNWVRTNRMRYRVQGIIPLQGKSLEDREFYLNSSAEVMLNWGANVQQNVFDQNRLLFMLGRRFSRSLRMEAGYMEQLSEKSNGRFLERNHTLMLTVFPSLSLVR